MPHAISSRDEHTSGSTNQAVQLTRKELTARLHEVGKIYWHRPDTADCLVKVVRLSSCQHERHPGPDQQCLRKANNPSRPTSHIHSAPTSASASACQFPYQAQRRSQDLHALPGPSRRTVSENHVYTKRSRLVEPTSPFRHSLLNTEARRESAPPNMLGAASAASATQRPCLRCDDSVQNVAMYRLHSDFLKSQSDLFAKMLCSDNDTQDASASSAVDADSRPHRAVTVALPDPTSFEKLVEYFYMGDFSKLSAAMESGKVRWENVMLNARHLGLSQELKMQLGAWWRIHQGHSGVKQGMHRGSLPTGVPAPMVEPSRRGGVGGSSEGRGSARPRAYTTGTRPQIEPAMEKRMIMTPSRAFASLPKPLPRLSTDEHTLSGVKRRREADHSPISADYPQPSKSPRADATQQRFVRPALPVASGMISLSSPVRRSPISPRFSRDIHSKMDLYTSTSKTTTERPSAVRQLLNSGNRRRALSSLAYYCSTGVPGSVAASVKP